VADRPDAVGGDEELPREFAESRCVRKSASCSGAAEKTVELDFFKGACKKSSATPEQQYHWREASTTKSRSDALQGSLSIERLCQLAGVSRAGFYRSLRERAPVEKKWKRDRRFKALWSSIGGATAIGGSPRSCASRDESQSQACVADSARR